MSQRALDIKAIEAILPQRFPFLLIDKVLDYKENEYLIAAKNVTGNEWACGEGKGLGAFPETLLVEAALQAAILFYHVSRNKTGEKLTYLIGKIQCELQDFANIGDVINISVLNEKLMQDGGYVRIKVHSKDSELGSLSIFFSIKR